MNKGLTLLELMLAIGMLMIVATMLFPIFGGFFRQSELENSAKQLLSVLRKAQQFSQSQEGSDEWVVAFWNVTTTDYYELYPSSTPTSRETFYLPANVIFTDATVPTSSPLYIKFKKFTGQGTYATTTPPSFVNETKTFSLALKNNPSSTQTIEVGKEGKIAMSGDGGGGGSPVTKVFQEGCTSCSVSSTVPDTNLYTASPADWQQDYVYSQSGLTLRTVISFDTSSVNIPIGVTVQSAVLGLCRGAGGNDSGKQINAYKLLRSSWIESQATKDVYKTGNSWGAPWAGQNGVDRDESIVGTGNVVTPVSSCPNPADWTQINVTSIVQSFVNNGAKTDILLQWAAETNDKWVYFWSSEYTTISARPKLTVEYR